MKNGYYFFLFSLGAIAAWPSCTLDKEPDIPIGASNEKAPVFATIALTPDTSNNFQAKARLSSLGTLNILQHGWVWSEKHTPTLLDSSRVFGSLTIDSFSTEITGLDLGKPYYMRPFVITGADTIYGPERCSFLGVDFTINTDVEIFQGAVVQFTNTSAGNNTYSWNFGDGGTSTDDSPLHTFNTLGSTQVRLTAENNGCLVIKELTFKVIPNPFEGYWVGIPGGTFMMGCTSEQGPDCFDQEYPVHQMILSPFLMGKTEITQGQWEAVMGTNPSTFEGCPDCPVEWVSWNDITRKFLPALSKKTGKIHRLPSEAEWEYAARGGANAPNMTKYSGSDSISLVAWYYNNAEDTHPVGQKKPNGYGLYDMSGNVYEIVEDDWHNYYLGAPVNGSAWIENPRSDTRVERGGSWDSGTVYCRAAFRIFNIPSTRDHRVGFRLARSL